MKRLLAVMICLAMLAGIGAAWAEEEVSPEASKVEVFGIPTVGDIAEMKAEADELWEDEDYDGAAEAYEELAKQAGWMLEIVTAVSSSPAEGPAELVARANALAEEYLAMKKLATVRAGLGHYYSDDYDSALPFLMEALAIIDAGDTEDAALCAGAVMVIIGEAEAPEEE